MTWRNDHLEVRQLPTAHNPIFVKGKEAATFDLKPGEHFVIGQTTFTLTESQVSAAPEAHLLIEENTINFRLIDPNVVVAAVKLVGSSTRSATIKNNIFTGDSPRPIFQASGQSVVYTNNICTHTLAGSTVPECVANGTTSNP